MTAVGLRLGTESPSPETTSISGRERAATILFFEYDWLIHKKSCLIGRITSKNIPKNSINIRVMIEVCKQLRRFLAISLQIFFTCGQNKHAIFLTWISKREAGPQTLERQALGVTITRASPTSDTTPLIRCYYALLTVILERNLAVDIADTNDVISFSTHRYLLSLSRVLFTVDLSVSCVNQFPDRKYTQLRSHV